jgi:hypothetical protein
MPDDTDLVSKEKAKDVQERWDTEGWTSFNRWQPAYRGQLKARAKRDEENATDPCTASPDARYDRPENQLYRVEVHKPGQAAGATFKWSRENGSVVYPILKTTTASASQTTTTVTLEHLGPDAKLSLNQGDWVEIVNDEYVLHNRAEPLLKVLTVNHQELTVTLSGTSTVSIEAAQHPLLRRWDHKAGGSQHDEAGLQEGAVPIAEGTGEEQGWLKLEHGIEIQFQPADGKAHEYRTGDHWLIPARTDTEDVEWPGPEGEPEALLPHGVEHHYAPLWLITEQAIADAASGDLSTHKDNDCRRKFDPAGKYI